MTSLRNAILLRNRIFFLDKAERKRVRKERIRLRVVKMMCLRQRMHLGLEKLRKKQKNMRIANKKRRSARRETAKLNRTLKRRRKR